MIDTNRHSANLYRRLGVFGTPIPTNELWIAALVVQHDRSLSSRDMRVDALLQRPRVGRASWG